MSSKLKILFIMMINVYAVKTEGHCPKTPLGTKTDPLPADNKFKIHVLDLIEGKFIPGQKYTVTLNSTDGTSTFIAFTVSLKEDTKHNDKNPRRPILLDAGLISPGSPDTVFSCNNTIIQADITPKKSINVTWVAPGKGSKCVTIYAVVAVKPDVWYSYEGPLSVQVCEDERKSDDMQPLNNDDCRMCDDAKYQLTFEGLWSINTHPKMYPSPDNQARFSDMVGASHSSKFTLWKVNNYAGPGLKMLAEQGNTTQLEKEIQEHLGVTVRTVVKANGPPKPNMTTNATFRVTREHHLLSLAAAIQPSPDWFLGVSNLELCEANRKIPRWAESITLNLYPWDAGTDSGKTLEAANDASSPSQPINAANVYADYRKRKLFARLKLKLIRTYKRANCVNDESTSDPQTGVETNDNNYATRVYNSYTTPGTFDSGNSGQQETVDPESGEDCPTTPWEDWLPCEGACEGDMMGQQIRLRYNIVNNIVVGKYMEDNPNYAADVKVPEMCSQIPLSEFRECKLSCSEDAETDASQSFASLKPGERW